MQFLRPRGLFFFSATLGGGNNQAGPGVLAAKAQHAHGDQTTTMEHIENRIMQHATHRFGRQTRSALPYRRIRTVAGTHIVCTGQLHQLHQAKL